MEPQPVSSDRQYLIRCVWQGGRRLLPLSSKAGFEAVSSVRCPCSFLLARPSWHPSGRKGDGRVELSIGWASSFLKLSNFLHRWSRVDLWTPGSLVSKDLRKPAIPFPGALWSRFRIDNHRLRTLRTRSDGRILAILVRPPWFPS